jgi:glycosyltransferase involved in cell wall biosynthesis
MLESKPIGKERTVTFVLPGGGKIPTGGFKVVYEYANHLAERGWRVRIVHPRLLTLQDIDVAHASLASHARQWLGYQRGRITGRYRPDSWFKINPKVELLYNMTLEANSMPPSDVWVATFWYTAKWVAKCAGARLYLIQHLETWCGPEADVMATWKLPLRKVVISRWLEDVARSLGESCDYIPNGLDFKTFGIDLEPEKRDPNTIAMLYHRSDWKGSADGLRALLKAKARVPGLRAQIFGVYPRPSELPAWVEYHRNPPQPRLREIYNEAAIFLSPSWTEGWGLPPAEALQCGAALAATDIGGHREYALHEQTALLSPPKNPDALAANVLRLLEDPDLRIRVAHQGNRHIQQFTWNRAVTSFEAVLESALAQQKSKQESLSPVV